MSKYAQYHCEECGCQTDHYTVYDTDDLTHEAPIHVCEECGQELE